jgi:copper resistance protein B
MMAWRMLTVPVLLLCGAAQAQGGRYPLPPADWPSPVMDRQPFTYLLLDRLEHRWQRGADARVWDAQAWFGGDDHKLWFKTEGEQRVGGATEEADARLLYAHRIRPFWYLQAGVRAETRPGPTRKQAVLGVQGLAPYEFGVEAALYLRGGEVAGRLEAEYDLLLSQRLILQPRLETNFSSASDRERGVGSGINDVQLGLRLRYEIRREIAPYIGVSWTRRLGNTADIARAASERVTERGVVAGIRVWY